MTILKIMLEVVCTSPVDISITIYVSNFFPLANTQPQEREKSFTALYNYTEVVIVILEQRKIELMLIFLYFGDTQYVRGKSKTL